MNSRELVRKTLLFDSPERIPRQLWLLPWAEEKYPEFVERLHREYPDDIIQAPQLYHNPPRVVGDRYRIGTYVDEWGCTFHNVHDGVIGIVHEPLIRNWENLSQIKPPEAVLYVDIDEVNAFCNGMDTFVIGGTGARPLERLQFLRTMEQALIDLVEKPPELFELLRRIHTHYCKEVEAWCKTDVDAVSFMDDWGTQKSLMASPEVFRTIFKPMYREYAEIAHRYGKFIFMHSDGWITDIIGDLAEIGIDALNSQVFCMGVKELGEKYRGKITFWGEIDRQHILPHGTKEEIERAIHEVYEHLYADGGVIAQCEFGPGAKPENVMAVFEAWDKLQID